LFDSLGAFGGGKDLAGVDAVIVMGLDLTMGAGAGDEGRVVRLRGDAVRPDTVGEQGSFVFVPGKGSGDEIAARDFHDRVSFIRKCVVEQSAGLVRKDDAGEALLRVIA
jgi:hypothetical protein